jgi:release factor glutamine methyltransferase
MTLWTGPLIRFGAMRIQTDERVYGPDDDTFLLDRCAHVRRGASVLEVGCGTGFVSVSKALGGALVSAADIDPVAVALTRHNASLNGCDIDVVRSDIFSDVEGTFDVVLFNPPYLPTAPEDRVGGSMDPALSGGRRGDEVLLRFVDGLDAVMSPEGRAYVVLSSLTPRDRIEAAVGRGFRWSLAGESESGMERLESWVIKA